MWRVTPGVDCRVAWLHDSHPFAQWAPAECSWLIYERESTLSAVSNLSSPAGQAAAGNGDEASDTVPRWLIVCRSAVEAEQVADALGDAIEAAWGAEVATAIADTKQAAAAGVRGAALAIVSGVRWSRDAFVDNVDGLGAAAGSMPTAVDPSVRAAVAAARDVTKTVASVAEGVKTTVAGAAFVAGRSVVEGAESTGMLEGLGTSHGRAAQHVTATGLRAACDVLQEVSDAFSTVWEESSQAVAQAVQHAHGDEAAEVTSQALAAGGDVGGAAMGLTPVGLARRAAFAATLGAAKVEVPGTVDAAAVDAALEDAALHVESGVVSMQNGVAAWLSEGENGVAALLCEGESGVAALLCEGENGVAALLCEGENGVASPQSQRGLLALPSFDVADGHVAEAPEHAEQTVRGLPMAAGPGMPMVAASVSVPGDEGMASAHTAGNPRTVWHEID